MKKVLLLAAVTSLAFFIVPANADQLTRMRRFNEELRTALGVPTYYNEALGSTSLVSVVPSVALPLASGASLTAVTVVSRATVAALTAVAPPLCAPETSTPLIAVSRAACATCGCDAPAAHLGDKRPTPARRPRRRFRHAVARALIHRRCAFRPPYSWPAGEGAWLAHHHRRARSRFSQAADALAREPAIKAVEVQGAGSRVW